MFLSNKKAASATFANWPKQSAFWVATALVSGGLSTSAAAAPETRFAQLKGASSTPMPMTSIKQGKPQSRRDPIDLERLRAKGKEKITARSRVKVGKNEILSGSTDKNEVQDSGEIEVDSGQMFLEGTALNNAGKIIVKGPKNGQPGHKGELILRNAILEGTGAVVVQEGGSLSIEDDSGNSVVRGLDITIEQGGELVLESDNIEFDSFTSPNSSVKSSGRIVNRGQITLRGKTKIKPGAHTIENQRGGQIIMESGEFEANNIGNLPGASIIFAKSQDDYAKHLKRAKIWNHAGKDADGKSARISWQSGEEIEIGAAGYPLGADPQGPPVTDRDIQNYKADVVIVNTGELIAASGAKYKDIGPPQKRTTGARLENLAGGVISGGGLLHASIINNGGEITDAPPSLILAQPSAGMQQITGSLSVSSGSYAVSINSNNYGQFWAYGTVSVGPATCNVTTTCATGFPVNGYVYPILKSTTNVLDSNTGTKVGFENIYELGSGCSHHWTGPATTTSAPDPNINFKEPDPVPSPTTYKPVPPKCYVIKVIP